MDTGSSPLSWRSDEDVGDILKVTPLGTVSSEYRALISVPNKWVAKPKLHECLWKIETKSSGITSRLVSKQKIIEMKLKTLEIYNVDSLFENN